MNKVSLYGGKHTVVFKGKSHQYTVDGILTKGVTSIIQSVVAKNGLNTWPLNTAMNFLKEVLDNNELIEEAHLERAKQQHIISRNAGASTGTAVHKLAASLLQDEKIDLLDYPEEVILAVEGFEQWLSETTPDVVGVEQMVFSEESDYIGTFDSLLRIKGKNYLCDLKTTNTSKDAPKGVYAENFIQLGAYAKAYLEERNYYLKHSTDEFDADLWPPIDDLMIISARKNGKVNTVKASELGLTVNDCIKLWECVLTLHIALEQLKKGLGAKK